MREQSEVVVEYAASLDERQRESELLLQLLLDVSQRTAARIVHLIAHVVLSEREDGHEVCVVLQRHFDEAAAVQLVTKSEQQHQHQQRQVGETRSAGRTM